MRSGGVTCAALHRRLDRTVASGHRVSASRASCHEEFARAEKVLQARKSGTSTGLLPDRIDASESGRIEVHATASYRSIGLLPLRTASTKSRMTNQSPPPWPVVFAVSPSCFQYGCWYWSRYFSSGSHLWFGLFPSRYTLRTPKAELYAPFVPWSWYSPMPDGRGEAVS